MVSCQKNQNRRARHNQCHENNDEARPPSNLFSPEFSRPNRRSQFRRFATMRAWNGLADGFKGKFDVAAAPAAGAFHVGAIRHGFA